MAVTSETAKLKQRSGHVRETGGEVRVETLPLNWNRSNFRSDLRTAFVGIDTSSAGLKGLPRSVSLVLESPRAWNSARTRN